MKRILFLRPLLLAFLLCGCLASVQWKKEGVAVREPDEALQAAKTECRSLVASAPAEDGSDIYRQSIDEMNFETKQAYLRRVVQCMFARGYTCSKGDVTLYVCE